MIARVGSRVLGEHLHPGLVERFTVLEGELTVRRDGKLGKLAEGQTGEVRAGQWHDWWNASDRDARVIVEVEPGERFAYMLETLFGLAELGHVDAKGMPNLLQMALIGREFSDTVQFKSPPPAVQKALFAALAPIAHALGYRATYPQLSRSLLAPDPADVAAAWRPPRFRPTPWRHRRRGTRGDGGSRRTDGRRVPGSWGREERGGPRYRGRSSA